MTLSQEIIKYLESTDTESDVKQIARATRIDPDKISKSLYSLHKTGQVIRTKNKTGRYKYTLNKKTTTPEQKESTATTITAAKKPNPPVPDNKENLKTALDRLEQRIKTLPPAIADIELKISTLQRLSELLDNSIASVLTDIKTDLINLSAASTKDD